MLLVLQLLALVLAWNLTSVISQIQLITTHQTLLYPNQTSTNLASIEFYIPDDITLATSPSEWIVNPSTKRFFHFGIKINDSFAFDPSVKSKLQFEIHGNNYYFLDFDLSIAFSVGASQYISMYLRMDNDDPNQIYPDCDISNNPTASFAVGDVYDESDNIGWRSDNIMGGDVENGVDMEPPNYDEAGALFDNDFPLIYTIYNDPINDEMFLELTNPFITEVQRCGFGQAWQSNQGITLYIAGDDFGEEFGIELVNITLTINETVSVAPSSSSFPSYIPSYIPSLTSLIPTVRPTKQPTDPTTTEPSSEPTGVPTMPDPTAQPSSNPTALPSMDEPTNEPTKEPIKELTKEPTNEPITVTFPKQTTTIAQTSISETDSTTMLTTDTQLVLSTETIFLLNSSTTNDGHDGEQNEESTTNDGDSNDDLRESSEKKEMNELIIISASAIAAMLICLVIAFCMYKRKSMNRKTALKDRDRSGSEMCPFNYNMNATMLEETMPKQMIVNDNGIGTNAVIALQRSLSDQISVTTPSDDGRFEINTLNTPGELEMDTRIASDNGDDDIGESNVKYDVDYNTDSSSDKGMYNHDIVRLPTVQAIDTNDGGNTQTGGGDTQTGGYSNSEYSPHAV